MNIGLTFDEAFMAHRPRGYHPETPDRLTACLAGLDEAGLTGTLHEIPSQPADRDLLETVHDAHYLDMLDRRLDDASGYLDPDTYYSPGSLQAALLAAGSSAKLATLILAGELDSALALVRPPGHHARPGQAMGFCLLNNAALAASMALRSGAQRVAILDWDVHHGNGTQEIFFADHRVLYCSLHQYPHYPGTGRATDLGQGSGLGTTINCPMPAGSGAADYGEAFRRVILPAMEAFDPDMVILSSGFDSHRADPLGGILLDESDYRIMTLALRRQRARAGKDRFLVLLEGGYNLDVLGGCTAAVVEGLAQDDPASPQAWLGMAARREVHAMLDGLRKDLQRTKHPLPDPE